MENFNATCPHGTVIKMQHAHYGRMRVGRCLSTNYLVGCYANALQFVDAKCSGHHQCEFSIMDPQLYAFQPCRKDLMSYLEASYTCVPVASWSHRQCENNGILPVENSDGHLQFNLGPSIPAGSASCPYHVTTLPGQKLQFSAYNFQTLRDFCTEIIPIPKTCDHQIVFQDGDKTQAVELCDGRPREEILYTSQTSEVSVHLRLNVSQIALHGNPYGCFKSCTANKILVSHRTVGCADLAEIPDADVIRSSDETALVKCRNTHHTFNMVCKNNQWVGDVRNCSHPTNGDHTHDVINGDDRDTELEQAPTLDPYIADDDVKVFSFNFSKTSSIAIAISCGLLFGLIIGVILLFALRNRRRPKSSRPPSPVLDIEASISKSSSRASTRGGNGSPRGSSGSNNSRSNGSARGNSSNGSSIGNGSIGNGSLMVHGLFMGNGSLPGSSLGNGSSVGTGSQRGGGSPRDSNSSRASNVDNYIYEV